MRSYLNLLVGHGLVPYTGTPQFKDPPEAESRFAPHYEKHIKPFVADFEEQRIGALHSIRSRSFISVLVVALILIAGILVSPYALCFILIVLGWAAYPVFTYKRNIKKHVFPKIFEFYGTNYQYAVRCPISAKDLYPSKIVPSFDIQECEDYITGNYRGVDLDLFEAHLEKEETRLSSRTGVRKERITVFKDIFIRFSVHKKFNGQTVILLDTGRVGNWLRGKPGSLERVALEDPVFEKQFEVHSSDQIEARYLLTTSFMQRLLKLGDLFGDARMEASFYEDQLLVKIATKKNWFEAPSIFKPATFEDAINDILQEMAQIHGIIDVLKLDLKIGV